MALKLGFITTSPSRSSASGIQVLAAGRVSARMRNRACRRGRAPVQAVAGAVLLAGADVQQGVALVVDQGL